MLTVLAGGEPDCPASPVQAWLREYAAYWRAGDLGGVVGLYSPDGVLIERGAAAFGWDAIRSSLRGDLDEGIAELRFEVDREWASETMACAAGAYYARGQASDGTDVARSGGFVLVLERREDGGWRAVADAVLADLPAPLERHELRGRGDGRQHGGSGSGRGERD